MALHVLHFKDHAIEKVSLSLCVVLGLTVTRPKQRNGATSLWKLLLGDITLDIHGHHPGVASEC